MRVNVNKRSSTKAERRFFEILKRNHIPFQFRNKIAGREVDFIIDKIAIEIGNHSQDTKKNKCILEGGYSLLFISNQELRDFPADVQKHLLENWIKNGKNTN